MHSSHASKDKPHQHHPLLSELYYQLNHSSAPQRYSSILNSLSSNFENTQNHEFIPYRQHCVSSHDDLRRPSAFPHQAQVYGSEICWYGGECNHQTMRICCVVCIVLFFDMHLICSNIPLTIPLHIHPVTPSYNSYITNTYSILNRKQHNRIWKQNCGPSILVSL